MNRSIKLLSALAIGFSAVAITSAAHADEKFSLHLDVGATQPLTVPQSQLYQTGLGMNARGLFNLTPWFQLGPVVEASYFPKQVDDGSNAGVIWQLCGAARLQRSHNLYNDDGVWSPYINVDVTAAHTGNLWRPGLGAQVGFDMTTDTQHSFWFGPYLGYTHLFQTSDNQDGQLLDKRDVNLLTAGLSVTFDFPPHHKTLVRTVHDQVVVHDSIERVVVVAARAPETLSIMQHVYFDWDKSTLRWESKDKLDEVVTRLNKFPNNHIRVQGHASVDGQRSHNEKLAAARAEAVRSYLVAHGVDGSRLVVDNFGVDHPAASNKSQEGRERSRRVEFEVTFTSK